MDVPQEWKFDDPKSPWNRGWRLWARIQRRHVEDDAVAPRWWLWAWCLTVATWIILVFLLFVWIERAIA